MFHFGKPLSIFSFEYNYGFANLFQVFQVLNNIQLDGQKIATRIPDFTIQNGQLQTKEKEGFIYQTNSIILHLIQRENEQNRTSLLI